MSQVLALFVKVMRKIVKRLQDIQKAAISEEMDGPKSRGENGTTNKAEADSDESNEDNDDDYGSNKNFKLLKFPDPPTRERLAEYKLTREDGPTIDNFQIDFSLKSMATEWNRDTSRIFSRSFKTAKLKRDKSREDIEKSFMTYLRSLCK